MDLIWIQDLDSRFKWKGLFIGVGGLLQISLIVTGVLIGVYNTDVLTAENIETG